MRISALVLGLGVLVSGSAQAQSTVRLKIDPRSSLAWWQVNPHLEHLWATTCPADPSWRPGEGTSLSAAASFLRRGSTGHAAIKDTIIPLYPRRRVRALCTEAVSGEVTADTTGWTSATGNVAVKAEYLVTGLNMRDEYARKAILQTALYPEIRFAIDSITDTQVRKSARGDTVKAVVHGVFELHGVKTAVTAPAKVTHEAGGLRVRAQFFMDTKDLIEVYGLSKMALGLGVGQTLWEELHMGVDVLLVDPSSS